MGQQTYKGIIEWEDTFDGEKTTDMYACSAPSITDIFNFLISQAEGDGVKITCIAITLVGSE